MVTRAFTLLMGAALLTTLAACQGKMPDASSAPSESHEDKMAHGEEAQDHMDDMAMDDAVFSGTFQKAEHDTKGTFAIHKHEDRTTLRLSEDFATNAGAPDLYVAIGASANPIADKKFPYPLEEGEYVTLSELTSATGAQTYEIPGDVDLSEDNSVIIWCKQFNATMSYAPLEAAQ